MGKIFDSTLLCLLIGYIIGGVSVMLWIASL